MGGWGDGGMGRWGDGEMGRKGDAETRRMGETVFGRKNWSRNRKEDS